MAPSQDLSQGALAALQLFADITTVPAPELNHPAIAAFSDQFMFDVSSLDDSQRAAFFTAAGDQAFAITQQIYVRDMAARLRAVLGAVIDLELPGATAGTIAVGELWGRLEEFMAAVARLDVLDPTVTEMVRLRGARLHDCRVCKSRRSRDAVAAGATEGDFAAIDDWPNADLPNRAKAALGLVDAMVLTPTDVPTTASQQARLHLTDDEIVEVLLDVVRNAANKIAVALGADAATVNEGVELFTTDGDGNVVVLP